MQKKNETEGLGGTQRWSDMCKALGSKTIEKQTKRQQCRSAERKVGGKSRAQSSRE